MAERKMHLLDEWTAKHIAIFMIAKGYTPQRRAFRRELKGNWVVVTVQHSTRTPLHNDASRFTLNLGILCTRVAQYFEAQRPQPVPDFDSCHVKFRLGDFLNEPYDVWWEVGVSPAADSDVAKAIGQLLFSIALPQIELLADDAALRDLWLAGRAPGLTDFERLMNLSALVMQIGPHSCALNVASELDSRFVGKAVEARAREQAAKVRAQLERIPK